MRKIAFFDIEENRLKLIEMRNKKFTERELSTFFNISVVTIFYALCDNSDYITFNPKGRYGRPKKFKNEKDKKEAKKISYLKFTQKRRERRENYKKELLGLEPIIKQKDVKVDKIVKIKIPIIRIRKGFFPICEMKLTSKYHIENPCEIVFPN